MIRIDMHRPTVATMVEFDSFYTLGIEDEEGNEIQLFFSCREACLDWLQEAALTDPRAYVVSIIT